ncbi:mutant iridoid synthase [Olea europaea subsp. europaea]|uniref:Mutant iridoid synthase n=1 Tax=Olea europaea subsp. europaea TaxID=158383 RepID=A0A8S0T221_OLEEU|nr:mutant iridoid synthase [Olea europaea subsp. europaea]
MSLLWHSLTFSCDLQKKIQENGVQQQQNGDIQSFKSVALIVGVTGIVGSSLSEILQYTDTPGGPWKVYGVARRPRPTWLAKSHVEYVQCDVTNTEETISKISPLTDITHIFYVSWMGNEDCSMNAVMFQNILNSVIPNAPNLQHICLQTGSKHYIGLFETDTPESHDTPYSEDLARLKQPNFYHNLEDILFEETAKKGLTWSVHRPALIFGFSPCSLMNIVSTLSVYAAICKHENKPLVYPGSKASWNCFVDAADAELAAEHQIWAAVDPNAKNQAFNCTNGDLFKWKHIWKVLANQFDLEMVGYIEGNEQVSMEELMKDKDSVWDEIVKKNNLMPTKLKEIAAFWFADIAFCLENVLSSTHKNRLHGFMGFRNTYTSFVSCIDKMRAYRFIP